MNKGLRDYLDSLPPGTVRPIDPSVMAEYERSMREETIPAIERELKAQARAAHFARLGIPDPLLAIAAGSRRAKTPQAVECEASQSGHRPKPPTTIRDS